MITCVKDYLSGVTMGAVLTAAAAAAGFMVAVPLQQPVMREPSPAVPADSIIVSVPCLAEDGNGPGRPCVWTDPETGVRMVVVGGVDHGGENGILAS